MITASCYFINQINTNNPTKLKKDHFRGLSTSPDYSLNNPLITILAMDGLFSLAPLIKY